MRRLFLCLALLGSAVAHAAQRLPAKFDHDRIHLAVTAPDGSIVTAYVDSGGGMNIVSPAVAARLKLAPRGRTDADDMPADLVAFPPFLAAAGVPAPLADPFFRGHLVLGPAPVADSHLFLGAPWLAGRTWVIDYARHALVLDPQWRPSARDHAVPIGFRTDEVGRRLIAMPRIVVTIAGEPLDMLLDTGAMVALGPDGAAALHLPTGTVVGASFISRSVFDRWHAQHPQWRIAGEGEAFQGHPVPMIEVPQVRVGGLTVGPVWFARRADANFSDGISLMMDQPAVGAFGGSGLHHFHVVLDYVHAMAWIRPANE